MRVTQEGTFDPAAKTLRLTIENAEPQIWRFEMAGDKLVLFEKDERHEYTREGAGGC